MKVKGCNLTFSLLFFFLLSLPQVQGSDFTKVINKDFPLSKSGSLEIKTQRGEVKIEAWDQAKVSFQITIRVEGGTQESANEFFNSVNIDFENSSNRVSAETELDYGKTKDSWWPWYWASNKKKEIKFSIDYLVKMPRTANFQLAHKYGNAIIQALEKDVEIDLSYGDLQMEKVGGKLNLELGYGNAWLINTKDINAEVRYSKLSIAEAANIDIESRYSELSLETVKNIRSESKYDRYSIGTVNDITSAGRYDNFNIKTAGNLEAESMYSDYRLEELLHSADLTMNYGEAIIGKIAAGFSEILLNTNHVNVKLSPDKSASYQLDIESDYSSVAYPSNILRSEVERENSKLKFKGIIGNNAGATSRIKAKMKYGNLRIN